jgi:hypothetical protein
MGALKYSKIFQEKHINRKRKRDKKKEKEKKVMKTRNVKTIISSYPLK